MKSGKHKTYRRVRGTVKKDFPNPPDIELNTFSATDCTGLIPSAVDDESEQQSYEELYPFSAEQ